MAQSGLETLYQHLGPATASMVAGNREYDANQTQTLADQHQSGLIAKQQADAAHAVNMNPLLVEQQQQTNTGLGLTNTGLGIKNTTGTLANQLSQATQPGVIEGTNAENKGKVGKEQIDAMTRGAEMAGQLGIKLEQTPPLERQFVVEHYMKINKIDPDGEIGVMIRKTPIENLPGILKIMQTKLHQSTKEYQQAMDLKDRDAAIHKYSDDSRSASSKYSADSSADASRYGADQRLAIADSKVVDPDVLPAKASFEQTTTFYMRKAAFATSEKDRAFYLDLAKTAELMGKNQGNARAGTTANLNEFGIATNPVVSALDSKPKAGTSGKIIDLR